MKMKVLFSVFSALLLLGCQPTVDVAKEKNAVDETLNQWINAFQDEDAEMLASVMGDDPDMIFFGTDAQERWVGKDDFIASQKEFFEATSESKIELYNKTIKVSGSGTVAWSTCMMKWDVMSGDQPMHLEGIRFTMVFEKRDNNWIIVQGHGSVPVAGQGVEY
jgi:uncharacterized protein (TIGR02246 family)